MRTKRKELVEVYVWEIPVRLFHWINAGCIVILCITGYIIGDPPAIQHGTEAIHNYWFGWVRLTHLAVAMLFVVNFLVRAYWSFVGNKFAHWRNFIPLTKEQWRGIYETIKVDILLLSKKPVYDIGHNSLAATTYFGLVFLIVAQSITGFMMMFVTTNNIMEPVTTWGLFELGGFFVVRFIHHALMWGFILFSIIHIYLVFYHDYIERNGVASSIIGGWKFINVDIAREYEEEEALKAKIKKSKKRK